MPPFLRAGKEFVSIIAKRRGFTILEIMLVAVLVGVFAAVVIKSFITAMETSRANTCYSNLDNIESAIGVYALDYGKASTDEVDLNDLIPEYITTTPYCPSGGEYIVSDAGTTPECSIHKTEEEGGGKDKDKGDKGGGKGKNK